MQDQKKPVGRGILGNKDSDMWRLSIRFPFSFAWIVLYHAGIVKIPTALRIAIYFPGVNKKISLFVERGISLC
jgi:hypothetical protein